MTLFQMWEKVKQHFPDVGMTQFKIDVNKAYKQFCHETRIYKQTNRYNFTTGVVSFTLTDEFPDIDGSLIIQIDYYNSSDKSPYQTAVPTFSIVNGELKFYSFFGEEITTLDGSLSYANFTYTAVPDDMLVDTDEPVIDAQYHSALVDYVLADYYSAFSVTQGITKEGVTLIGKDFKSAQWFKTEYKQLELSAKRKANETI